MGGLLGWGKTKSSSQIIFDKNEFYIGEWANVRVICDNVTCKKDVRAFKFKLIRCVYARSSFTLAGSKSQHTVEVSGLKVNGCKAGEKVDKIFQIQIP